MADLPLDVFRIYFDGKVTKTDDKDLQRLQRSHESIEFDFRLGVVPLLFIPGDRPKPTGIALSIGTDL